MRVAIMISFLTLVSLSLFQGCSHETSPTSSVIPTDSNTLTASSTDGSAGKEGIPTGSSTTTSSSDVPGVSDVRSELGDNNKNDGYVPSDNPVDWVSVLNGGNYERNVFAIGFYIDIDDTTHFYHIGTGFAAGFSNVIWTNAHVVDALDEEITASETDSTFVPVAIRSGPIDLFGDSELSLANVRTIKHLFYDGSPNSEDVAAYIFADEPFKHEPLPTLLPMRFVDELVVGQPVGTIGFPGELSIKNGGIFNDTIVPTFKDGTLSAIRSLDFDISGRLLQYNLTITGGTSGSPVFDHLGYIIGMNHAGYTNYVVDTEGNEIGVNPPNASYAIRVDALHELIPPVYNSPASIRRSVSNPYPSPVYLPFPD